MKKIFKILSRERCFKEDVLGEVTDIQSYRIIIVCRVLNFIFSLFCKIWYEGKTWNLFCLLNNFFQWICALGIENFNLNLIAQSLSLKLSARQEKKLEMSKKLYTMNVN